MLKYNVLLKHTFSAFPTKRKKVYLKKVLNMVARRVRYIQRKPKAHVCAHVYVN